MMNLQRASTRVLLVIALGLAAISGLSVVLEALALPPWFVQLAVLASFVGILGLAVTTAVQRNSVEVERADGF